ncbi:MAG: hypothetical protein IPJ98_13675 [Bryobacterales bacterium]|nr:hypothetical protein [Bryobacterales bacterium]
MLTNARPLWRTGCLALLLAGCSAKGDHPALRHLIAAELIEREQVSENNIKIEEILIEDHRASVRVMVRGRGGPIGKCADLPLRVAPRSRPLGDEECSSQFDAMRECEAEDA